MKMRSLVLAALATIYTVHSVASVPLYLAQATFFPLPCGQGAPGAGAINLVAQGGSPTNGNYIYTIYNADATEVVSGPSDPAPSATLDVPYEPRNYTYKIDDGNGNVLGPNNSTLFTMTNSPVPITFSFCPGLFTVSSTGTADLSNNDTALRLIPSERIFNITSAPFSITIPFDGDNFMFGQNFCPFQFSFQLALNSPAQSTLAFVPPFPTSVNPSCAGAPGSISFQVAGGIVPYSACITNSAGEQTCLPESFPANSLQTFANLSADTYTLTVTEFVGCTLTSDPIVLAEAQVSVTLEAITQPSCNGGNGSVTFTVSGGTAPFSACLAPAANPTGCTPTPIEGSTGTREATAGSYVVFVVDSNGCTGNSSVVTFTEPAVLSLNAVVAQQVSCNGGNDGQIVAAVCGGTAPYRFFLNGALLQTSSNNIFVYRGLSARTPYTVSVNDANNCGPLSQTFILTSPGAIALRVSIGKARCCEDHHAHAVVTVSNITGGTAPYTYSLQGKSRAGCDFIPVNEPFTCVKDGKYLVTVKDANGCTGTQEICVNVK